MHFVQPNQEAQDDLAALLSRNLRLDPAQNPPPPEEPRIVYISQHYTHSRHVPAQPVENPVRSSSEPPQPEYAAAESVLRQHNVDPSGLSVSQLQLFKEGDTPQQMRLIELWQICPPVNSTDNPTLTWTSTTVEQEEMLAKMRHEQQQREEPTEIDMTIDDSPLTPIQAGDGRWVQTAHNYGFTEPYMASGYEALARREYEESARRAMQEIAMQQQPKDVYSHFGTAVGGPTYRPATDPVYQTAQPGMGWQNMQQQQQMEDQYGRMMQIRNGNHDEEML